MAEFEIRVALLGDVSRIADVFRQSSLSNEGDRPALLANPDALVFDDEPIRQQRTLVAVSDELIIGFATTRPVGDIDELDDLFVDPDWMRRGVARSLIAHAITDTRARGAQRIEVTANGHALAFYTATGFDMDGTTDTDFGPGYRMHLDIAVRLT